METVMETNDSVQHPNSGLPPNRPAPTSAACCHRPRWLAWTGVLVLGVAALIGTSLRSSAVPLTYSYDDSAAGGFAGVGVFTLEVGVPLGRYNATGVAGAGDAFGVWGAATFLAQPGFFPMLTISNLVGASVTLQLPAIGGGVLEVGSSADLEWQHFIEAAGKLPSPIRIVPLSAPVSDGGPSLVWSVMTLAGVTVWARAGRGCLGRSGTRMRRPDSVPGSPAAPEGADNSALAG